MLEGSEAVEGEGDASNLMRSALRQILSGAAHLESMGVVHRDIKPSNIFCDVSAYLEPR